MSSDKVSECCIVAYDPESENICGKCKKPCKYIETHEEVDDE